MRNRIIFMLFSLLFIAGCVPSLHQLWTEKTLIYDEAIVGKYEEGSNIWEFVGDSSDKSYKLTIYEQNDKQSRLTAHLVQIGDQQFFDFYPADDAELEGGDWLKFHVIPVHIFFHVKYSDPNLMIAPMVPDEIADFLKEKSEMVKHEMIQEDRVVLTDKSENLQRFLLEGLRIEKFYGDPQILEMIQEEEVNP